MTHVYLEKNMWGKWKATYPNGKRTFIQGHYLYDTKTFDSISLAVEWAKSNYSTLDCSPGGGYGVGVAVVIEKIVIAEYYREAYTNKEILVEHFKHRGW